MQEFYQFPRVAYDLAFPLSLGNNSMYNVYL